MKNSLITTLLLLCSCASYRPDLPVTGCLENTSVAVENPDTTVMTKAMQRLVKAGIPGCAIATYSEKGWWMGAAGWAKLEDKTPMQTCHLHYLQSISKTYLAVAVLTLMEQGKLRLDTPMTTYLPETYSQFIHDAGKITVRMLLNHTSGVPEYNFAPAYITYLLQHPAYVFTPAQYLGYIAGKPLDFVPGSRYSYRNTNYLLLALMLDHITGDHARFITQTIVKPLGLTQTFYRNQAGYLTYPTLVNTYWDRHSNGIIENVSLLQRTNVASLIGDDGIVTTPVEAVKFLRGLMEGKLLSAETMAQMTAWVLNKQGRPAYGLGLVHATINGQEAIGHSGGGIGAGCELYYFPKQKAYLFIGINLGTVTQSPLHAGIDSTRGALYDALLK